MRCPTVTSFGVGDLSAAPLVSNTVCVGVEQVAGPAGDAGASGSPAAAEAGGSGCDVSAGEASPLAGVGSIVVLALAALGFARGRARSR